MKIRLHPNSPAADAKTEDFFPWVKFNHGVYSAPAFNVFGQVTEQKTINAIRRTIRNASR